MEHDDRQQQPATRPAPPRPFWERIFVVGWSMSMGLGTATEIGADVPMGTAIDHMILAPHESVLWRAGGEFYFDPAASGLAQLASAWRAKPSCLIAVDFPFWFLYGAAGSSEARLARLDVALLALAHFSASTVVIGTVPAYSGIFVSVDAATLERANARIQGWAKERPNVVVLPLHALMDDVKAGRPLAMGVNRFPAGSLGRLLQGDGLHPRFEGLCAIASYALCLAAQHAGQKTDGMLALELEPLMRRAREAGARIAR
jgi:hypothetical protein